MKKEGHFGQRFECFKKGGGCNPPYELSINLQDLICHKEKDLGKCSWYKFGAKC